MKAIADRGRDQGLEADGTHVISKAAGGRGRIVLTPSSPLRRPDADTASSPSRHVSAFPWKRLVKACTKRFRGNVLDRPASAKAIGPTPCPRQMSVFARVRLWSRARANLTALVLTGPGRNSRLAFHRTGRFSGNSGGKRRPEPHGHKSFRPSFSTSSVPVPTTRSPRLTRDSLEGTPGGAC
jgi:hypothetical protein